MVAPTNAVCGYTHPASLLGLRVFTEKNYYSRSDARGLRLRDMIV